jgi:hypothetical protein
MDGDASVPLNGKLNDRKALCQIMFVIKLISSYCLTRLYFQVREFSQCFDATEVLRPKSDMNPYPTEDLAIRDLVVVEVNLTRFKLKQPGSDKKNSNWVDWRAQFELRAVSLLGKSTPGSENEESQVYI